MANSSWEDWWITLKGKGLIMGMRRSRRQGIMAYTAWHIWKQRNTLMYQNEQVDKELVVRKVLLEENERWMLLYK